MVSDNVREAFFVDVIVHSDFQGRGIGRQIVRLAVKEMTRRGMKGLHVDCAPSHAGFYEKCGFNIGVGGWIDMAQKPRQNPT
jgi:predicted N-acetyltransferase YhbS